MAAEIDVVMASAQFRKIKTVLVIGAGTMGRQIAQIFAQRKFTAYLSDIDENQLTKAREQTEHNLTKRVAKGKLKEDRKAKILAKMNYTTDWVSIIKGVDLVVEAVPEILGLKQKIFAQLIEHVTPGTICGTNSSTIVVSKLVTDAPTEFQDYALNIHFSNPPLMLKLIELYSATGNQPLLKFMRKKFRKMHYEPIVVNKPINAFVMNRVLGAVMVESFRMIEDGVCSVEDLDTACTAGLNWPLGIARIADLVGLDVVLDSMQTAYEDSGEDYQKPTEYLKNLVAQNRLGMKTKHGIYDYRSKG